MDILDLNLVKQRLGDVAPALRLVGFAAEFSALSQPGAVIASPSAYVIVTGEEPAQVAEGSGPLRQWLDVTISVLVAVRLAGPMGAAGLAALEEPVAQVRAAVFGWAHPDAERKFHLGGGGIEDFDAKTGVLIYRLDFIALCKVQETLA